MFVFLFLLNIFTMYNADKEIAANDTLVFIEKIDENDESLSVSISNHSRFPGLRVSVKTPSKDQTDSSEDLSESSFDEMGDRIDDKVYKKRFTAKGEYVIMVANTGKQTIMFNISSYKSKTHQEGEKGIETLRNALQSISSAMDQLRSENYYYNTQQTKNIKEARSIKRMATLLVIFPILTILIGYGKHVLARQTVKPQKKKFKKVF